MAYLFGFGYGYTKVLFNLQLFCLVNIMLVYPIPTVTKLARKHPAEHIKIRSNYYLVDYFFSKNLSIYFI